MVNGEWRKNFVGIIIFLSVYFMIILIIKHVKHGFIMSIQSIQ